MTEQNTTTPADPQVYTYGPATVTVPADAYLRLTVTGEEDDPADLTAQSASLLAVGYGLDPIENDEAATVEFATLECSDEVTFTYNGDPVDQDTALKAIETAVVLAIRAFIDAHRDEIDAAGQPAT